MIISGTEGGVSAHRKLWGYEENYRILGTDDPDCRTFYGPRKV